MGSNPPPSPLSSWVGPVWGGPTTEKKQKREKRRIAICLIPGVSFFPNFFFFSRVKAITTTCCLFLHVRGDEYTQRILRCYGARVSLNFLLRRLSVII